jgi:GrpB-like predicted nucleotidyltransferase (UPF0157 family)
MCPHPESASFRRHYFRGKLAEDALLFALRRLPTLGLGGVAHAALGRIHRDTLQRLRGLPVPAVRDLAPPRHLGVARGDTFVTAYDPAWPKLYELEAGLVKRALGERLGAVFHIGSTAVPGLAAKPIVDIAVALWPESFEREYSGAIGALARIGYRYLGYRPGLGGHYLEKGPAPIRTHAIQLHPADGGELAGLLRFRDQLRRNPALAAEYQAIKHGLATRTGGDRRIYLWYKAHWMNDLLLERREPRGWSRWLLANPPPSFYWMHLRRRPRRRWGRA